MRKSKLRFWGFLAPSLIAFCIVVIIPTCIGFFYSLTNWNGIVGSDIKFVGFQNFIDIFTRDDSFVHAFLFTALFSVCAVVLVNLVGFTVYFHFLSFLPKKVVSKTTHFIVLKFF